MGIREGDPADFVVFGKLEGKQTGLFRRRTTVKEVVYDAGRERTVIKAGCRVSLE